MLPKTFRLNLSNERFTRGDFQIPENYFKLLVKKGYREGPKIGFIASSKVGNAVARNKVRRILSSVVEKSVEKIPAEAHIIFIAYPQASSAKKEDLVRSVTRALGKV